jgi:hypothetical protein
MGELPFRARAAIVVVAATVASALGAGAASAERIPVRGGTVIVPDFSPSTYKTSKACQAALNAALASLSRQLADIPFPPPGEPGYHEWANEIGRQMDRIGAMRPRCLAKGSAGGGASGGTGVSGGKPAPGGGSSSKPNATTKCIGPSSTHTRLMAEPWRTRPAVLSALNKSRATFQSNRQEAPHDFAFDDFSITIEQMPPGVTPEQLLERFARDPNGTVENPAFDALTRFDRRGTGHPKIGTIYDIAIPGDPGSVMLVEKSSNHFVVQTIETPELSRHPVSGARQFGFERNADGSITFYTRGADRPDNDLLRWPGLAAQNATWSAMMHGLRNQIRRQGGKVRPGPIRAWRRDIPTGC